MTIRPRLGFNKTLALSLWVAVFLAAAGFSHAGPRSPEGFLDWIYKSFVPKRPPQLTMTFRKTAIFSKGLLDSDKYTFSRSLIRITPSHLRTDELRFEADADFLLYTGDYVKTSEWGSLLRPQIEGRQGIDLDGSLSQSLEHELRARIYRFYAMAEIGPVDLLAGRMRNAFGNSRLFLSPFDRMDPLPTLVSDPMERLGSDGARLRWRPQDQLKIEAGYLGSLRAQEQRAFMHAQYLATEGLELSALAGRLEPKTSGAGASAQWSLGEGVLGWEGTWNEKEKTRTVPVVVSGVTVLTNRNTTSEYSRQMVRWEQAWRNGVIFQSEIFHNGSGESLPENYDMVELLRGEDAYLGRDYLAVGLRRTFNPLWSASFQGYSNIKDGGFSWNPELRYVSPGSKLEIIAQVAYFAGPDSSEYGRLPDRTRVLLSWFFD